MSEVKLRECPFCGSPVEIDPDMDAITCVHASKGCGFYYTCCSDYETAIKQWNTRHDDLARELAEAARDVMRWIPTNITTVSGKPSSRARLEAALSKAKKGNLI